MQPENATPDLPDDYYLVNVTELLEFVSLAYADLLSAEEADFARRFNLLSEPAARLYVRLLLRSKTIFRDDKLNYPEITDISTAAEELAASGFLHIDPLLELEAALTLLTKPELVTWLKRVAPSGFGGRVLNGKKRGEIEQLVIEFVQTDADERISPSSAGQSLCEGFKVYETRCEESFQTFKLCFFGNLYQDMTDFVLRDLGLTRYESYRIDHHTRAFSDRQQLEAHLQYYTLVEDAASLDELSAEEAMRLNAALPAGKDLNLQRRCDRFRNRMARELERAEEFDAALQLYQQSTRPPARERQARIYAATAREQQALSLCREVVAAPLNEEERQIVSGFGSRLAKKMKDEDWIHEKQYSPPVETITLENSGESVELQAQRYFANQGECFYTENVLFDGVFGLAFWEQIFMPVAGMFFNPFQHAPADFYDSGFVRARESEINQQFEELAREGVLQSQVVERFASKFGLQNPMVNWRYMNEALLECAMKHIPVKDWLAVFHRLFLDTRLNRSGLPDLILFPATEKCSTNKRTRDSLPPYVLIEIKGPGDSLQKNQRRWMQFFDSCSIAHKLCHVEWQDESAG